MSINPDDKPFEMKSQEPQDIGDNTPIAAPSAESNPEGPIAYVQSSARPKGDRTLWYTIGGMVLFSCCGIMLLIYLFTRTSQFKEFTTLPALDFTPMPTPDMNATQGAWVRPQESPSLGDAKMTERLLKSGNFTELESFAIYFPFMPEVNQPGDIYVFAIEISSSQQAIWNYGWCTLTPEILDQNFKQMKIEFFLNEKSVSQQLVAISDYQPAQDRYCRTYNLLVAHWPKGTHLLESNITFLKPTDDGWNVYPAGTHTFRFYVTVQP